MAQKIMCLLQILKYSVKTLNLQMYCVVGRGSSKHFIKNRYKKLQLLPGGYVSLCRRQEASLNKHFGYELYEKWDITKVHMVFKFVHNE